MRLSKKSSPRARLTSPAIELDIERARAHASNQSPEVSPKDTADSTRHSLGMLTAPNSMMDLSESPSGGSRKRRQHRRSDSQVWRPRDASSRQRPSWASIGHHAIVPWRSSFTLEETRSTIRVVEGSEGSEYDVEKDSIWSPLEGETQPLLQEYGPGKGGYGDETGCPADWLGAPRPRLNHPAMPSRCSPSPPTSGTCQESLADSPPAQLKKQVATPRVTEKKSAFVEHLDENREVLKKLGIPYEDGKRRKVSDWFNSLKKISSK
ncbi:hypothetical protein M409DRAFT_22502 [Zasmidium cellare ATCC 36951]|uniref:Uncharacterized protein n=1 Tax=Zasmidium cellare ATCC 36951 TaxID=1080233 RepID=A0A6A6CIH3_ZASCE|nr:uncharacterized protein M409DRAFT_22502 [Zasmidium cellare ATCC 36951]KAF2167067.1 hypothetical protein M409DRAFT_22502 [Zasmidium cellare ATCC 36951]